MKPQELVAEVVGQIQGSWRFRWRAAIVTWLICALGWFYVYTVPDIYGASARVYVSTETILKPLMEGLTAQKNPMTEVQTVSTAVLSRPNLELVARQTGLDLRTKSADEFQTLVSALKERIGVKGGTDNIYTITFEDHSREMAEKVVTAILDNFVEGSLGLQGDDTQKAEIGLAGEIAEYEKRLDEAEAALAKFRTENLGYMPNELGDYHTQLQAATVAADAARDRVRQLEQRRDELVRQMEGEEPVFGIVPTIGGARDCALSGQIAELEAARARLLVDYKEAYPPVKALTERIAGLQQQCEESGFSLGAAASVPDSLDLNPVYQNLKLQLSSTNLEVADARAVLRTHEERVAQLRADVDKIAQVETEFKALNRDYDVVQTRYKQLLNSWEDLQAKKRLDPVTDDWQFRTIDPPFAPPEPVGPNRPLLLVAVLVFALGAGFAIAFGMNRVQPVYYSPRGLRSFGEFPVLGAVTVRLDSGMRRRRRSGAVAWASSYVLLIAAAVVVIMFANPGSALVREALQWGAA